MIASLRGTVVDMGLTNAVIECAGVGYLINAVPSTLATLTRGEEAFVLTTLHVREDAMTLYGFSDSEQQEMFALLQTVSGVGAKLALAALSVYSAAELAALLKGGDAKGLQKIPGVGKRSAERMVVELKDKVVAFTTDEPTAAAITPTYSGVIAEQVIDALVGLGFKHEAAGQAVEKALAANPELDTSGALAAALRLLGKK